MGPREGQVVVELEVELAMMPEYCNVSRPFRWRLRCENDLPRQ